MVSGCYLYAITPTANDQLPRLDQWRGLDDQPLQWIAHVGLAALVSVWGDGKDDRAPVADTADLLRHEAVIEAIMGQLPTLPVRFGTILAGAEPVRHLLATRQRTLLADLAHITGRVEMGVRILWEPPAPNLVAAPPSTNATPGLGYLQAKAKGQQQAAAIRAQGEALAQAIDARLRPLAADAHLQVLQTERLLLSAAYLVPQPMVAAFCTKVTTLRRCYPTLAFLASGPWPAYHFIHNPGQEESRKEKVNDNGNG